MAKCPTCKGEGYEDIGGDWATEPCARCDGSGEIEPDVAFYSVGIFLVDRAYGGPEEGGWYFDCGDPVNYIPEGCEASDLVRIFSADATGKSNAYAWRNELQAKLDAGVNVGRREISSVLSEGMYSAEMMPGYPRAFPAQRPHYE